MSSTKKLLAILLILTVMTQFSPAIAISKIAKETNSGYTISYNLSESDDQDVMFSKRISMFIGQSLQFKQKMFKNVKDANAVIYSSSDPDIVTVDENGLVTALSPGTATLTLVSAEDENIGDGCTIMVHEPESINRLEYIEQVKNKNISKNGALSHSLPNQSTSNIKGSGAMGTQSVSSMGAPTGSPVVFINDASELQAINEDLLGHYVLADDIDLDGVDFESIGSESEPFEGTFDGNGYTIYNLVSYWFSCGLFAFTNEAVITNVTLSSAEVYCYDWEMGAGALAGSVTGGLIDSCFADGEIFGYFAGGLVGISNGVSILNSGTNIVMDSYDIGGGLIGACFSSMVSNCYSEGSVHSFSKDSGIAGGLIGVVYGSEILRSYASGNVSGKDNSGGLIGEGYDASIVENCYAIEVYGQQEYESVSLVGAAEGITIKNSFIAGLDSLDSVDGGLFASGDPEITNSYFKSVFSGISTPGSYARTDSELKQKSTFVGWDFVSIWGINEGQGYPYLRNQSEIYEFTWPESFITGQLLVCMNNTVPEIDIGMFPGVEIVSIHDLTDISEYVDNSIAWNYTGRQILLVELALYGEEDVEQLMREAIDTLISNPAVAYAEPNPIGSACAAADKPDTDGLWGIEKIKADLAWVTTTGSHNVLIGVLDSGVDHEHPGLAGNINESLGYNFLYNNPFWWYETTDPTDDFGHGTSVSGILGATGLNGKGVQGVSPSVTIIPLKIWDSSGIGSAAEFIAALTYAEYMQIPVLNLSGGWTGSPLRSMKEAIEAYSGLLIAAAGNKANDNDNPDFAFYPASFNCENIISVAASDQDDLIADFSGYGAVTVDLTAPGSDILSTADYWLWDNGLGWYTEAGYEMFSGTSTAVAHVSGAAALVLSEYPGLNAAVIKAVILDGADYCLGLDGLVKTNGRLNVYEALVLAGML